MLTFPAWDCLPYDRASPVAARRSPSGWRRCTRCSAKRKRAATARHHGQRRDAAHADAVPHPPARRAARARRADRPRQAGRAAAGQRLSSAPTRSPTPANSRCAAALVDLFPGGRGAGAAPRFLRRRDRKRAPLRSRRPAHHRPDRRLHPAARLRSPARRGQRSSASAPRYRETFGANATGDPLYQAVSDGRRLAGMEHWLPLFEERLATLFDHLGDDDLIVRDAGADGARRGAVRGDRRLSRQPRRARRPATGQLPPARARRRSI